MTDQRDDKAFEAFLAGKSELTDRYAELGREEPPPELDAHILAEGRKAANIHQAEFGPRGGWLKPVALAATVLLSFSLVMKVVVEMPVRFEQVVTESTDSSGRLEAEQSAEKLRAAESKREISRLPSVAAIEEVTVTARQRTVGAPQPMADMPADVPLAESEISPKSEMPPEWLVQTTMRPIDRDMALSIVTEYIEAADSDSAEADEMAQDFVQKNMLEKRASSPSGRIVLSTQENRPADDFKDDPEAVLREIRRLHVGGDDTEAGALLDDFLARYPEHPVSVNIRQQGY